MADRISEAQTLIGFAIAALVILSFIPDQTNGKGPWDTK